MPYRKEKHRILSGSLNLLPPGDKIPEEDSLILENFRPDQAGQLQSRRGIFAQSGQLAGGICHTLFRRSFARRYAGVGARLYESQGFNAYAQIFDGFDGQPLGLASYQDFTWIMNQAHQFKQLQPGATPVDWTPAPPGSAPSAAPGAQTSKVLATFDSGEAWVVTQPNGNQSGQVKVVDYNTGTVDIAFNDTAVVGSGTNWDTSLIGLSFQVFGDAIIYTVIDVTSPTDLVIGAPYQGVASVAAYSIFHLVGVFNFDSSNKIAGTDSLHIACNPPGTWQAYLSTPGRDFGLAGQQRDDDEFHIWIYASNPAGVEEITLAVDVNTGNFSQDFYYCAIPGSQLSPLAFGWTEVIVRRALNVEGILKSDASYVETLRRYNASTDELERNVIEQALAEIRAKLIGGTLAFVRNGDTVGKDWSTAVALQAQVRVSEALDVHFDEWDVRGGVGGLDGDYQWYVTFDTDEGHESNGSPASAQVHLNKQGATLTNIATSPDPQITKRHIYRQGGALDGIYRVATIPDNSTTGPLAEILSDEDAQTRHTLMPIDHDPAPPCLGLVRAGGKLIAYNSAAHPGRYWWTRTAQPWFFPGSDDDEEGQWEDAGEEGEPILAATEHKGALWLYKERTIWRIDGDPDRVDAIQTNSAIGAVGPRAVANAGGVDYLVGPEGLYRYNGEFEERVSPKLDPIFRGEYVDLGGGLIAQPLNLAAASAAVLEFSQGRLYLSYPEATATLPTVTLIYHIASGTWSTMRLDPALLGASGFTALYYEGEGRSLTGATSSGAGAVVYELEVGSDDDGQTIFLTWMSRFHDQGLSDNEKRYSDLVVTYRTAVGSQVPGSLTVRLYYDNGAAVDLLGTLQSSNWDTAIFRLNQGEGRRAMNAAVHIEGTVSSTAIIKDVYLHWYPEVRWAKSFDTGVMGSDLVEQIDEMEIEVTAAAAGTMTWIWQTDLPGGLIQQRQTGSIALTAGRRVLAVHFPSLVEGRKRRLILASSARFQLHALRVRVLDVAVYVDGTVGDFWESREVSLI